MRLLIAVRFLRFFALMEAIVAWSFFHDPIFVWYVRGSWYEQVTYALMFWIAADFLESLRQ